MGYPMAGHIRQKGGHDLKVYNRNSAKSSAWVTQFGGSSAATPAEVARDADFVFCCVGNDDDLRAVTLGEDGCFVSLSDETAGRTSTPPHFSVGPAEVSPVDTTGAGDAFNGGLASALSRVGMEHLEAALVEANQVAGLSIEKPGTAPAMPTKAARERRFGAAPA